MGCVGRRDVSGRQGWGVPGDVMLPMTYVTNVELRQDLTGPSAIPTTPERCKSLLLSPAQQRVRVWRSVSPDRRFIRDG